MPTNGRRVSEVDKYILLGSLSFNTRGYFASCVVFASNEQNVREYYMLDHLIRDLWFRYKKVLFRFNFIW